MCTVMLFRETLPAEKCRREEAQAQVDELMAYDRKLADGRRCGESPGDMESSFLIKLTGEKYEEGIYVWLDSMCFGNSRKKGFYYVRRNKSILAWGSTAYAPPMLIVQKNKLRPDQIKYMERKRRETLEEVRRQRESSAGNSVNNGVVVDPDVVD